MQGETKEVIGEYDKHITVKEEKDELILSKHDWTSRYHLENFSDYTHEQVLEILEIIQKMDKVITKQSHPYDIWIDGNEVTIYHENDLEVEYIIEETEYQTIIDKMSDFFKLRYIPVQACYREDYFELLINHKDVYWGDGIEPFRFEIDVNSMSEDKIYFEISEISKEFANIIENKQSYSHIEIEGHFSTLKVFNINKVAAISIEDNKIGEKLFYYAKTILFDLSFKYSLPVKIDELPEHDEEEPLEGAEEEIQDPFVKKLYDPDLINYYYRAVTMSDSEFKYLAYYQIIECIFDEVYLHETVQDVKQIMNSSWFSSHNDNDIKQIIDIVDKYNKSKNDREKLKLVLERYFKGEIHEQAFLLANKEVVEILQHRMKKINQDRELNDLQKLTNILYDFRCECTHSNRNYPFRTEFENTPEELNYYIALIKKVTERVIVNYRK